MPDRNLALILHPALIAEFDEAFHTGLRKGLDSHHSVIAWNTVHSVGPVL